MKLGEKGVKRLRVGIDDLFRHFLATLSILRGGKIVYFMQN